VRELLKNLTCPYTVVGYGITKLLSQMSVSMETIKTSQPTDMIKKMEANPDVIKFSHATGDGFKDDDFKKMGTGVGDITVWLWDQYKPARYSFIGSVSNDA
jgi:hypothetical protein